MIQNMRLQLYWSCRTQWWRTGPREGPKGNDRRPAEELEEARGSSPSHLAERDPSEQYAQHGLEKIAERRQLAPRNGNGNAPQMGSPLMIVHTNMHAFKHPNIQTTEIHDN